MIRNVITPRFVDILLFSIVIYNEIVDYDLLFRNNFAMELKLIAESLLMVVFMQWGFI